MIIHHHEFLIRADERMNQLTAELVSLGGELDQKEEEDKQAKRHNERKLAKESSDLVLKEVSAGFPVLHSQQAVFLWGAIEAVVEDTLAAWLKNEKFAGKEERLRKIRISVADFNAMSENERSYHIDSEYRRELRLRHRSSIEAFETALHEFGLRGAMDPQLKRSLIELECVRNVMLHRRGVVDSRFLEAWRVAKPWRLFLTLGVPHP